jgi:predicted DNA-binding protein (UPF0251 family)
MEKSRILKKQNKAYLELPKEMLDYDEAEVIRLSDGQYLVRAVEGSRISEIERIVLKKLLSIRFDRRTPANVEKELTEAERFILKGLEKKGMVNVFKGRKYPDGVYNIKDNVYPTLRGNEAPKQEAAEAQPDTPSLLNRGFLTLKDKGEALRLSQKFSAEMKKGDVIGVKGFDGRFYVVTREYLEKSEKAVSSILKEGMDIESIAQAAKMDAEGCSAVMRLMAEKGDVLEKKKGIFSPI